MITGKNYIGYAQSAKGDKTYHTFNPKENKENPTAFYEATQEEIEKAVSVANSAFTEFRAMSGEKRAAFLNAAANEIEGLGDTLFQTYMSETGLPEGRAKGECGRTLGQLRMFAELIKTEDWRNPTQSGENNMLRQLLIPLGPVVVFGASNFPLAYSTAGGDTASALAAGCPVIVKSHPMHAGTGELVASAIVKAAKDTGMPDGVFSNLNSSGIEVGVQLVKHPKVKAVGFTGSIKGGRALYDLAAQREEPIPVFAEMGSINPVIITQKALENRSSEIAQTYADSITLGVGQFCTNPGLILGIASTEMAVFVNDLGAKTASIDPHCMLHPNIHKAFESNGDEVLAQNEIQLVASYQGVTEPAFAKAKIATVPGAAFLKNTKLHQEVFGPFSLVVQCENEAQLLEIITIIAEKEDYSCLSPLIESLQDRVGRIIFNGVPTGVAVVDAMTHGGPYPASTDSRFTAVGNQSIKRWVRPFSYQEFPEELLPEYLK
jgi:NADP-dependent aldehyde dehydrogenase